jgi:hypothetical protein
VSIGFSPAGGAGRYLRKKKADVVEYRAVFNHVGLLVNEPPVWVALYLVIRPSAAQHTQFYGFERKTQEANALLVVSYSSGYAASV